MSSLDTNAATPSWFVQILFGRYRNLGNIGWTHLTVLGGVGFVMLYTYLYFLRRKFNHYAKAIAQLPRSTLGISKKQMGRRLYSLLLGELVRVDELLEHGLQPQHNARLDCGDPGWGKEGGSVDHVHFNTSIAKSYYVLEKTALSRRPGLRQKDARTIREYVAALRKAFPSLKQSLCEEYINTYERAVFGNHKCTYEEYTQFMKVVLQIVSIINEKSYLQQQQDGGLGLGSGLGSGVGLGVGLGVGAAARRHHAAAVP